MKLIKIIKIGLIGLLILLIAYQTVINKRTRKNSGSAPIISSDVDEIHIPCKYNTEDLLQGLTAYDTEDGYITEKILIGGFSDFTERGVSSLDYAVYDKEGNTAVFNRKVVFTDYSPPQITMSDPWAFKATDNIYNMPSLYLRGSDMLDGDISKHILITSDDLDFSVPGKYTALVRLKNSFGDEVNMDLPIHVLDPGQNGLVIELTDPLIYVKRGETIHIEQFVAALRNEYTGEYIPDTEYVVTIDYNDDESVDNTSEILDVLRNEKIIETDTEIEIETETEDIPDEEEAGIVIAIRSFVDTTKSGIYEIQFSAVSADNGQRGETWMTVIVGDYGG